jgi:Flp pilus assembly protein TadG
MTLRPSPFARRPGNVLPFICVLLVFLGGMVAFAIDTGYIAVTRTRLQRAADSGAHAGAFSLATFDGRGSQEATARDEIKKFIGFNESGTVLDADIKFFRYNPTKPAGARVTQTTTADEPANAVEVTVRRDDRANGRLPLFFGPLLGTGKADVRAKASAFLPTAKGILPGAPLIPYAMHVDRYYAALGQTRTGPDGQVIPTTDTALVRENGTVTAGSDGIREVVLFGGSKVTPGNFGSVDLGSASNGTPEARRQILYGPTWGDFNHPDFQDKLQPDGSIVAPLTLGGDPGLSSAVRDSFEAVLGKPRIVFLYDTVSGNGENTVYHVVGFAAVTITDVDLTGNPKQVRVQPTRVITASVTAGDPDAPGSEGIFAPPRMFMP